ncbi:MAG TPA: hypothetical protein PK014_02545 [Thermoanaerobaculia bacterium]|nr:hypothetical protein [Thermoanaerobaculia bacterium]HUM28887.1 hypothetical protein [Thermoanaerobaculia bacterium]HXK67180.1 hypothetical protein [Thermoanaerobaculia bacterium]
MRNLGKSNIGCIIAFIVLGVFGYSLTLYIPVRVHAAEFADFLKDKASYPKYAKDLEGFRSIALQKAKELDIPLKSENLTLEKTGDYIRYAAEWEQEINIFGYVYVMEFNPKGESPIISGL